MRRWGKRLLVAFGVLVLLGLIALEGIRFIARRGGVEQVGFPPGSRIAALAEGADYVDAYAVPLGCEGLDVAGLFPETGKEAARGPGEFVFRGNAPGLHFYASYLLVPPEAPERFILGTAVFYESWVGRVYFTPVRYVHRRIVPMAVSRQPGAWCPSPGG